MQNLYDLLGVRPDDDAETIKNAYRKAAKASHPDHHSGDPEAAARFRQISLAYEILGDAELRTAFDRLLESELRPLPHEWKRSWSDITRQVGHVLMASALLAIVLVIGYKVYDRVPRMPSDEATGVAARAPALAAARTAEGDKPENVAAAQQMPSETLATAAAPEGAASVVNANDVEENTTGEPASNPAARPMADVSSDGKSDIHAGAGVPAKAEVGPPVSHGAPSPRAPSAKMPARAAALRHAPSRQLFTPAPPAAPFEEFARQQELRNTMAIEELKRWRCSEAGYC
jgi:curved DNA-binding protein CbpA